MPTRKINEQTATTSYISNAIRERAGEAYQNAVPVASARNLQAVAATILTDPQYINTYYTGLIEFYVDPEIRSMYYSNHLKRFKMPLLNYGAGFIEYYVPPAESKEYDASGKNLINPEALTFKNKVYQKPSRRTFKRTLYERDLRAAFASESGAYELIRAIVDSIESGMEAEEYEAMKGIFDAFNTASAFPTIAAGGTTSAALMETIQSVAMSMQFPSTAYNAGANKQTTRPEDLVIFTDPAHVASVNVTLLATAFHDDKVQWSGQVVLIDKLPAEIENCVALIGDERFLRVRDLKYKWTSFYNSEGDFENVYLHKDTIYEASPFVNMVAITQTAE